MNSMVPETRLRLVAQQASNVSVVPSTPLHRYYKSSHQMLSMAATYTKEGDLVKAYHLYLKFLTLFVERVPKHPQFGKFSAEEKRAMNVRLKDVMKKSEAIKMQLLRQFQIEYEEAMEREAIRAQIEQDEDEARALEESERYRAEKERRMSEEDDQMNEIYEKAKQMSILDEEARINRLKQREKDSNDSAKESEDCNSKMKSAANTNVPPIPDRTTKPASFGSESGLRTVVVSKMVLSKFLSVASKNTANNVETCAILGGRLQHNRFSVTHIIVPRQSGTANSCTAHNEEDIFDYQAKHGLITLGWIHTHPSQSAFLSSVDLHTHLPYQLMLAEALAIVCAPSKKETRFLTLTQNHGLNFITNCRETGFHPHPEHPPLFEDASHVQVDERGNVELVDLRN